VIAICLGGINPPRDERTQLRIHQYVTPTEPNSDNIDATKEGRLRYEYEWGTTRQGDPERKLAGTTNLGPEDIWFTPLLLERHGALTVDNIPDGMSFGNGSTGPSTIPFRRSRLEEVDGVRTTVPYIDRILVTWTVFPLGTVLTPEQWYRLQEINEGVPPGNPEENVWRQFDVNGRDPAVYNLDGTLKAR